MRGKDIPTGNLPTSPAASEGGILQPSPDSKQPITLQNGQDRVIVRQPAPVQPAPAPAQMVRELSPEERRILAAYEREQQAIAAPTGLREGFGSASHYSASQTGGENGNQLAQLLGAVARAGNSGNQINPELVRTLLGNRRGSFSGAQDYEEQHQQAKKEDFLARARSSQANNYLKSTRNPALSPYEIKAGWEIPAVMEQALNSDLPGEVRALVTSNVYDTATSQFLLIRQGPRLVGRYSSEIG